ncbi:hypothetical protein EFA46_011635 (plasmid) [Halarchaeum sp. CBA1220]|uniref:hypothetical protein n=1 Tax=Halarchaeum sp. CBA1220 TaxID=1853682 RepID=UPI000F3AA993|nr:hypothetical protein [Halarchaeum sp. CBA1220]QLC34905.1 hypothetical protein EFA46_011635 [Halarchaeum sp. CBA1220]
MNPVRARHRALPGTLCVLVGVLLGTLGASLPAFVPWSPPVWGTLLLALGGVAAVAGVLDVFLSPGTAVPHAVAAALHDARAADVGARVDTDAVRRVYRPDGTLALVASDTALDGVPGDDAAVTLEPVGAALLERVSGIDGADDRAALVARLADAATGRFELADAVTPLAVTEAHVRVAVADSLVGDPAAVDHPVASLFGVALAADADAPVAVELSQEDDTTVLTVRQV